VPRSTRERLAAKPPKRHPVIPWAIGGLAVVAAAFTAFQIFGGDRHTYEIEWPESAPTGEPVVVPTLPQPGATFTTVISTKNRIVLAADYDDPNQGMSVDAKLQATHEVAAREGGGTRSTLRWKLLDANSNVPGRQPELWMLFGSSTDPYTTVRERDASGKPLPEAPPDGPQNHLRAMGLGLLLSGFVDPTLSFLPPGRPVRQGETWKLFEEVWDVPGMEPAVRTVTETSGEGFPALLRTGVVKAEALEDHDGQPSLRLRIVFSLSMEGDTRPPGGLPGRITMGGKCEGAAWVSLATGLPLEVRLEATLRSTLRREGRANVERAINQSIRWTTR